MSIRDVVGMQHPLVCPRILFLRRQHCEITLPKKFVFRVILAHKADTLEVIDFNSTIGDRVITTNGQSIVTQQLTL